jgi:hypothetical protein
MAAMIRTFIQIASLVLTLEAAIFLAKGNLGLSAQAIADLSSTKWGHNDDLIATLAQQRADTWVGVVFLLLAFFLQMWNVLWPMRWVDFEVHRGAVVYTVIFCLVLGFGAFFCAKEIAHHTERDVRAIFERPGASSKPTAIESE